MTITLPDARELPDEVLQELRLRALRGCEMRFSQSDIAEMLGVARETVSRWWTAYQADGLDGLPDERTGRPLGSGRTLTDEQGAHIQQLIDENSPEKLGIAAPLWSRGAVRDLIHKEYGFWMPVRTVGEYLKRWGYTAKRPQRHANDQDPEEVREWIEETYPEIERRAREEKPEPRNASLAQPQEAALKICDPIRVPANDPIFKEGDPATRAKLTPKVSFPSAATFVQASQQDATPSDAAPFVQAQAKSEAQGARQQAESAEAALAGPQPAPVEAQAKQEEAQEAEIDFVDEAGVAADEHPRYGYARKGKRATMEVPRSHIRLNTVATVNNKGELHYMTYSGMMNAKLFITFLEQLLRETTRKIFLIADRLSAHDCDAVAKWVLPRMDRIEVYFLPVRAPELNPVEYFNNDLKGNVHAAGLPNNKTELESNVQSFLRKLVDLPQRVRSYFQAPRVQYAAGY